MNRVQEMDKREDYENIFFTGKDDTKNLIIDH